mgnify:CR=1 FL=1
MTQCACRDCQKPVKPKEGDGLNMAMCAACMRAGCDEMGREACGNPAYRKPMVFGRSGYTSCATVDCFEIAISNNVREPGLCWECKEDT